MSRANPISVRVSGIELVGQDIKCFTLVRSDGADLPLFSPGSHVTVEMPTGAHPRRNPYSLMGSLDDPHQYQISVLRVPASRGGSHFMHDAVKVGDELHISEPVNLFQPETIARRHILFAGGIGITPFLSMMERFSAQSVPFELHYGARSPARAAFHDRLAARYGSHVTFYFDDAGDVMDVASIARRQPLGTHLYVCGPEGMINHVLTTAQNEGWPEEYLHSERFAAPPTGDPFQVTLARSRKVVPVLPNESILEAVEAAGVEAPCLCRGGACGQCETGVVDFDGVLKHNDHYLSDDEKASNTKIMICVSRLSGRNLTLDL